MHLDKDNCLMCRPPASADLQALLDNMGYSVIMTETELNGPERFAADDVLTEKQCQALIKLANVSALLVCVCMYVCVCVCLSVCLVCGH